VLRGILRCRRKLLNERATRATRARLLAAYMVVLYVGLGSRSFCWFCRTRVLRPVHAGFGADILAMVPLKVLVRTTDAGVVVAARGPLSACTGIPRSASSRHGAGVITSIIFSIGRCTPGSAAWIRRECDVHAVGIFAGVQHIITIGSLG